MPVFSKDQWAGHQGQGNFDEPGGRGEKTRCGRGGVPQLPVSGVKDRVGVGRESPLRPGQQGCSWGGLGQGAWVPRA